MKSIRNDINSMEKTSSLATRLVLLPLLLALAACGNLFPDDQELVQRAHDYLSERRVKAAAIELRNALQKNPDNAEARYLLGNISLSDGDYATAAKEFRRAAAAGWDPGQAATELARALLGMGNYRELVDEILVRDSYTATTQADLHALRALAEAGLGNMSQAGKSLDAAAGLDADSLQVLMATLKIHLAGGDTQAAEAALATALELYPDNNGLLLVRAGMISADGDTDAIREIYQRIIASEPRSFISIQVRQARLGLARLQLLAGELEAAEATIEPLYWRHWNDPETNYLGAMLAFEQGNIDLAEERIFKVLERAPNHSPTHLLYATVKFQQEDYEQAAYYLSKCLASNPDNINARKLLGRTYLLLGEHEEARKTLQPAASEKPGDAELLSLLGLSELQGGVTAAGIASLEKAVALAPGDPALRNELARAYLAAGEADRAIRELRLLIEDDAGNERSRVLLVVAYLRAGQHDQAIKLALEILQRDPDAPEFLAMTGSVFAVSGDTGEARSYFAKALRIRPHYLPVLVQMARLEMQAGAYDAALDYSARAVKTDPGSYAGYELAGNAWMGKQDYAEAGKAYMQAWERRQTSGLVLRLSHALAGAGNYTGAAGYLEQWLGEHEGDVRAREFLGTVYQNQGEDSKAVTTYETVLQQEPGNPVALNNLAWLYVSEDNPRALELAGRAYREKPDNAGIKDTYGWVLVQSGQAGNGLKLLTEAIDALPDVPEVRYHYAVALMKSGRQAEGRQRLRELLDSGAAFEGRDQAEALLGDS